MIPWKKIMVKFGFFEVQLGFKSCTGYFYERKKEMSTRFIKKVLKVIWLYIKSKKCKIPKVYNHNIWQNTYW
jgi:hypothetical protein